MRIVCPSCQAAYNVPDDMIGTVPRQLRCARCATEWTVAPPPLVPMPPSPIEVLPAPYHATELYVPEPPPVPPHPVQPPPAPPPLVAAAKLDPFRGMRGAAPPSRRVLPLLAWVLTLLVLAGAVAASYVWRGQIMAAWPPSQRVYLALGLR